MLKTMLIYTLNLTIVLKLIKQEPLFALTTVFMRPSSVGGGRILRRTLSVCPSVRLSVRPVIVTERHVAPPSELQ